jgi:hypothetical protein
MRLLVLPNAASLLAPARSTARWSALTAAALTLATALPAQDAPSCLPPLPALAPLGGDAPLHRSYTRPDSAPPIGGDCARDAARLISAAIRLSSRSGVPDVRGGGNAPATIGSTLQLRAGAELRLGRVQVRLAPEIVLAGNGDFLTFPGGDPARSSYASPFYTGNFSADLPLRPGDQPLVLLAPGESGLWFQTDGFALALTSALPDWGPGVGEGLVLGRSTGGLPRAELAAWRPLAGGLFRARWFGGAAVESRFFDADTDNDLRSVAGLRLSFERADWTVGVSRTVMDGRGGGPMRAALQPLLPTRTDSLIELLAVDLLFARPDAGSLVWLEALRQQPLREARDLFLMPTEGLALRVGASQRIAESARARWMLGFEAVRLDQPAQRAGRAPQDLYTSPAVAQGWTHRGQPLGSGLGPGGQRQMLSLDREGRRWAIGGFVERVRWNDDALYREFLAYQNRHDVTVQAGLRAGRATRDGGRLDLWLSAGQRLNYLFQNGTFIPGYRTDDVGFVSAGLSLRQGSRR